MIKPLAKDRRRKERIFPRATRLGDFSAFVGKYRTKKNVPSDLGGLRWFVGACAEVVGGMKRTKSKAGETQAKLLESKARRATRRIEEIDERLAN